MDKEALRTGLMTVFVVSGSVVILAHQFHKRLLSDFMRKMEFELGSCKVQTKKKVRFFNEELMAKKQEPIEWTQDSSVLDNCGNNNNNKKFRKTMPLNWQVMYKGIINYRNSFYIQ